MSEELNNIINDANTARQTGELEKAEELFGSALAIEPNYVDALYGLGSLKTEQGLTDDAIELLSKAADLEPEAADIGLNLGYAYAKAGQRQQALLELQRATKYCADDPVLCSGIANIFVALGEGNGALELMARLQQLTPERQMLMARAQGLVGDWSESVRILFRLSQEIPQDKTVLSELAIAAVNMGDFKIAVDSFEKYLRQGIPSGKDYLRFADLLMMAQNLGRAEQALQQALDAGESGVDTHLMQAKVAYLKGDTSAAKEHVDQVLGDMPFNGEAWYMASVLTADSNLEDTSRHLETAMQNAIDSKQLSMHQHLLMFYAAAKLADRQGLYELAATSLRQANTLQMEEQKRQRLIYSGEEARAISAAIKERYTAEVFDLRGARVDGETPKQPVFVVGMPGSGVNEVEKLLAQHKDVQRIGEQQAMAFIADEYQKHRELGGLPRPESMTPENWQGLRDAYLNKVPDLSKPVFIDRTSANYHHVGLILKAFPEAKVVQVRNEPKDAALSIYQKPLSLSQKYGAWLTDSLDALSVADDLMNHWSNMQSANIFDLNYQSLLQNPEYYAQQLFEFVGLEWSEEFLANDFVADNTFVLSEMQLQTKLDESKVNHWQQYADYLPEFSEA